MRCKLKAWWKSLNPFSKLIETRRKVKKLGHEREKLEKELKEIEEKRKKYFILSKIKEEEVISP